MTVLFALASLLWRRHLPWDPMTATRRRVVVDRDATDVVPKDWRYVIAWLTVHPTFTAVAAWFVSTLLVYAVTPFGWKAANVCGMLVAVGLTMTLRNFFGASAENPNPIVKSMQLRRSFVGCWDDAVHHIDAVKRRRGHRSKAAVIHKPALITQTGCAAVVNHGNIGMTVDELREKLPNIEAAASARAGGRVAATSDPGRSWLYLRHTDPLGRVVMTRDLPPMSRYGYIPIGLDEDGQPVELECRLSSVVVGATGAGKSYETRAFIRGLCLAGIPFRLWIYNPKMQAFIAQLRPGAYRYTDDIEGIIPMLGEMLTEMFAVQAELARREIDRNSPYTEEFPLNILIIDEWLLAAEADGKVTYIDKAGKKQTADDAQKAQHIIATQGRNAGYALRIHSQELLKTVFRSELVNSISYRTCLRVTNEAMTNMVLGAGAAKLYPAHKLSADEAWAGMGYIHTETRRGTVKYRGAFVAPEQWPKVCGHVELVCSALQSTAYCAPTQVAAAHERNTVRRPASAGMPADTTVPLPADPDPGTLVLAAGDDWWTATHVADYLRGLGHKPTAPNTWKVWAMDGRAPAPERKVGKALYWRASTVIAWDEKEHGMHAPMDDGDDDE